MKITDAFLRNTVGKPYKGAPQIAYGDGLSVRITPKGKVTWVFRFRFGGVPVKMKVGEYPALKISQATKRRDELRVLVSKGIDPRSDHIKLSVNSPKSVSALIEHYVDNQLIRTNQQWAAIDRMLEASVKPHIGDYRVDEIELADYVQMFKLERERKGPKHTTRLLYRMKTILNYGIRHGFLKSNPLVVLKGNDVGEVSQPRKVKLVGIEVGAQWAIIETLNYHPTMIRLLQLTMIFSSRISELRLAEKSHFNLEAMTWTVPPANSKTGLRIIRPIPPLALSIIEAQIASTPGKGYMFPRYFHSDEDLPLDKKTPYRPSVRIGQAMASMGYTDSRNHDIRRTARNTWEQLRFPPHVSETMLGHRVHTGTQAHYIDYDYLDEQRECYQIWCDYILDQHRKYVGEQRKVIHLRAVS